MNSGFIQSPLTRPYYFRLIPMATASLLALEPFAAFAADGFPCGGADVRFSFGARTEGKARKLGLTR